MKAFHVIILGLLISGFSVVAQAQATRTYVSGVGSDANPCSRTAPCRTFAGAIGKTSVNGEINCLDSGGYGSVTITKGITIDCSGVIAGVLASGGITGILINMNDGAKDLVVLRGLSIDGVGYDINGNPDYGTYGIRVIGQAPARLVIDHCNIMNFTTRGIEFNHGKQAMDADIVDTNVFNISNHGIASLPTDTGSVNLVMDRVRSFSNAGIGLDIFTATSATVRDSTFSRNLAAGILVEAGNADVHVDSSTMTGNADGVKATAGALTLSRCQISTNKSNGINLAGGTVASALNNSIYNNGGNEVPSKTPGEQ